MKIKDYFVWNLKHYGKVITNILGGKFVSIRSISDIFGSDPEHKKKTKNILTANFTKIVTYSTATLLPLVINSYTIITRWINRPERNPNEFHNSSKLSLAHIEFAGLVVMLSESFSHLTILFINNIVNRNFCIMSIPECIKNKFIIISLMTVLTEYILKFIVFLKVFNIFLEEIEIKFFSNDEIINDNFGNLSNYNNISNYSNFTNYSNHNINETNIYVDDTKFGQIDHNIFILLGIACYIGSLPKGIRRMSNFNNNIKDYASVHTSGHITEDNTRYNITQKVLIDDLKEKNISIYDPHSIREINYNVQKLGKFSLLRIMVWGRREIPLYIENKLLKHIRKISLSFIFDTYFKSILCKLFLLIPLVGVIYFILLVVLGMFFITTGLGIIGLIIKVNQVSFVGEIELLDWNYYHWAQFIGFLNNMLALDTSKEQSFESVLKFIFAGEDAIENNSERLSKESFLDAITCYSLTNLGVFNTLVILPQIGAPDIQRIFIDESEMIIHIEEERNKRLERLKEEVEEENRRNP